MGPRHEFERGGDRVSLVTLVGNEVQNAMVKERNARYAIGEVVKHRFFPFRGIIFDVDPVFNNTEEWWLSIPEEIRPEKDQPFYHLLAENEETEYVAYVSEQNLLPDDSGEPLRHPQLGDLFDELENGEYRYRGASPN
jgi:heat shock protein HspQ